MYCTLHYHSLWLAPLCGMGFFWHSDCSPGFFPICSTLASKLFFLAMRALLSSNLKEALYKSPYWMNELHYTTCLCFSNRLKESDPVDRGFFPRFGSSRFQYSGRTQHQSREVSSQIDRPAPTFNRALSKSFNASNLTGVSFSSLSWWLLYWYPDSQPPGAGSSARYLCGF